MRILKARYRSNQDFLQSLVRSDGEMPQLFLSLRDDVQEGDPVLVEIRLPELTDRSILRGRVSWRRPAQRGVRGGVGIEFAPSERTRVEFLCAVAQGQERTRSRNYRRLPITMPVDWRVKEARERVSSLLEDIGAGGAFIRTADPPPLGTPVVIELVPPGGAAPLSIEGRVAWERRGGDDDGGMGVEFRCRDTGGLRRLKELVRRLEQGEAEASPSL